MKKITLLILIVSCMYFSSCKKNTCFILGDTFQSIDPPTISQNTLDAYILQADMETMEKLTVAYFDSITIIRNDRDRFRNDWQNDDEIVAEFKFQKTNFSLEFKEIDLVDYGNISLHFRLRDREEFIDCEHGGSGDSYFFNVQFSIVEDSIGELSVNEFQWEEEYSAGPY